MSANLQIFQATGKRKTSIANTIITTKPGQFLVNHKLYNQYYPAYQVSKLQFFFDVIAVSPADVVINSNVLGGGINSQVEALIHSLAKIYVVLNPDLRTVLRKHKYLTYDSRMKERRKYGLKKARRAPQFSKR